MTREDRFRDRFSDRFRCLHRVRLRFPGAFAQAAVSACTRGGLRGASLCDISTPGCDSLRSSPASSELHTLASQLSATLELATPRSRAPLALPAVPAPVTPLVASLTVAHRVVAGRRPLRVCSRRSALGVLVGAFAYAIARLVTPPARR